MRRKSFARQRSESVSVDMSSLVDLSFLLLVFFLVTTTLLAKEQDIPMSLPMPGVEGTGKPIVIQVAGDGRVLLHPGQSYQEVVASAESGHELTTLRERLSILRDSRAGVQLDVDEEAGYQRFVDVLNCLRGEGWHEIAIREF